jgi:hypothetical protein
LTISAITDGLRNAGCWWRFVSTRIEHSGSTFDIGNAAANGEGNRHDLGHPADDVNHGPAVFNGSRNIKHGQFISAGLAICFCTFNRIARVLDIHKMNTFNHTPILHIQARHNMNFSAHKSSLQ